VAGFRAPGDDDARSRETLAARLRDIGVRAGRALRGARAQCCAGGDPSRIGGSTFALRRVEGRVQVRVARSARRAPCAEDTTRALARVRAWTSPDPAIALVGVPNCGKTALFNADRQPPEGG
jgi:hypothetical protein